MDSNSRILVCGAHGMVGSAIVRNLESKGYKNIIKGIRYFVDFPNNFYPFLLIDGHSLHELNRFLTKMVQCLY